MYRACAVAARGTTARPPRPPSRPPAAFSALVVLWSTAVAAQGPALQACAQTLAPKGGEAEALALPKASGDAVYIFAPFLLGVVADAAARGADLAVAGGASLVATFALANLLEAQDPTP